MLFSKYLTVSGELYSAFHFQTDDDLALWIANELPKLELKYGKLKVSKGNLDSLKIGDNCYVCGDGDEIYEITRLVKYSDNRYGFVLNSGFSEEVHKCYAVQ